MLGVEYIFYHDCLNDCMLYRGKYEDKEICPNVDMTGIRNQKMGVKEHGPPHNILRHLPIIPTIQKIFHCKELAML